MPHHGSNYLFLLIFLHHHLLLTTTHSLTLPSDISALKSFKSSIKPSSILPSSCLSSWNFSSDPCTLPKLTHFICGLTCNPENTRIISITLDNPGYIGTLSPFISKLTELQHLELNDNQFYGTIPSSISSLISLQTLSFRQNKFSGPLPSNIGKLSQLEVLDLSLNSFSGFIPYQSLFGLKKLTRLDLSFNGFRGKLPKLPSNLLELAVKGNLLSGPLVKASFEGLNQLEVAELSVNSITGTIGSWFFQLPSLQQVNLSNNSITGVEISKPSKIDSSGGGLVAVDLGFNKITGYVPVNFVYYPMLSSLTMSYNKLRGSIPWQFGKKGSNLRRLFLDGNYLIGKPPAGLIVGSGGGESEVMGSFGDNCLKGCPVKSKMCLPSQKPWSVCKQAYRRGKRLLSTTTTATVY